MTVLPDIPRLYTAFAECLAVLLFTPALAPRFSKAVTVGTTLLWAVTAAASGLALAWLVLAGKKREENAQ